MRKKKTFCCANIDRLVGRPPSSVGEKEESPCTKLSTSTDDDAAKKHNERKKDAEEKDQEVGQEDIEASQKDTETG
eukprot:12709205-Ditylum_brightwellii.AAC.2